MGTQHRGASWLLTIESAEVNLRDRLWLLKCGKEDEKESGVLDPPFPAKGNAATKPQCS